RPHARLVVTTPGQGLDAVSAKVSALMASIERWHGEYLALPVRWASYLALHHIAPVVDVTTLLQQPESELSLDQLLPWIEGYDLLQQQALWVPLDAVSVNSVASSTATFYMSSNGLAAGNHLWKRWCTVSAK